ncbi:MAG: peptide ABC transporter substrate-binding protein [Chlamydiae bacterium]|nr:peptide ABC transporter substrate-binding protein [Chlamydiota bacterium]
MANILHSNYTLSQRKQFPNKQKSFQLEIQPALTHPTLSQSVAEFASIVKEKLQTIIPIGHLTDKKKFLHWTQTSLPFIHWIDLKNTPDIFSIYLFCKPSMQMKTENIFQNILKQWLFVEKEIQIISSQHFYFYLKNLTADLLFFSEIKILIEDGRDLAVVQSNLTNLSKEIASAIGSTEYANYLLGIKALSYDQKTTLVHEELIKLIQKRPIYFDKDLFAEMGRFLALSHQDFRQFRSHRHLTRLIVSLYLMRKNLHRSMSIFPEKRHLEVRLLRTNLHFPFGSKPVLAIAIGINPFDKYESFEESHVLAGAEKSIQNVQVVKDSYYYYQGTQDPVRLLYLELEKKDGTSFSNKEIKILQEELKEELKRRIEKLIPSVFMIRNEEEIMKNILLLSQELKYVTDLPQVIISFDKQTEKDLVFTVIIVRPLRQEDPPLEKAFNKIFGFQCIPERVQIIGHLRKKYFKEANVFHFHIPKEKSMLRTDSSVNFYLARQKVVNLLQTVLGEIRDYNGGMILKQGELFSMLKDGFKSIAAEYQELFENFFFSLTPIEVQATLSMESLKLLFSLCLEAVQKELPKKESYFFEFKYAQQSTFVLLKTRDSSIREEIANSIRKFDNFSKSLIKTQANFQGTTILGFIYESLDQKKHHQFIDAIQTTLREWSKKVVNQQVLRLSFVDFPPSLDPRLGGDEVSATILRMLYEGLTRIGRDSKPELAVAKSVTISSDLKKYLFKLKECYWSNGDKIVAYDFEYAWKKILSPTFFTPFSYFFYSIKNAKAAKEGQCHIDDVKVNAIDHETLAIELEHPTPEFLELTAYPIFSPINHTLDKMHPNWAYGRGEEYICNGPFCLKNQSNRLELTKNSFYVDKEAVKLDRVIISKNDLDVACKMYRNDELDWIGMHFRPWGLNLSEIEEELVKVEYLGGVLWTAMNVVSFPFYNSKIRQAFQHAIDRDELLKDLPEGMGLSATSPLPFAHTQNSDNFYPANPTLAVKLFEEGLQELGIKRDQLPIFTLIHLADKWRGKIAKLVSLQLEKVLEISCRTESYEFHLLMDKAFKGDFQFAIISWKSWINDPMYTLDAFKYRINKINLAKWESSAFQKLLDLGRNETNLEKRLSYLKAAEKILIQEGPIIPLFYENFPYLQKKNLQNVFCSKNGNFDFKWSFLSSDENF